MMGKSRAWAEHRAISDKAQCYFYHTIDLPGGTITGEWDLRGRIQDYIGHVPVSGTSVLDVGTASGFLSFEMEKLGAQVVSFDAESCADIAFVPVFDAIHVTDPERWCRETDAFLERLKNSYWFCRRELGSRTEALYGDVYRLHTYGHEFDTAVVGQILVHLKDPVNALASVARVCRNTLVITEGTIDSPHPDARLFARAASKGPGYMWWMCSLAFYREVLAMQNFEIVQVTKNGFRCLAPQSPGDIELTTIVAHRRR